MKGTCSNAVMSVKVEVVVGRGQGGIRGCMIPTLTLLHNVCLKQHTVFPSSCGLIERCSVLQEQHYRMAQGNPCKPGRRGSWRRPAFPAIAEAMPFIGVCRDRHRRHPSAHLHTSRTASRPSPCSPLYLSTSTLFTHSPRSTRPDSIRIRWPTNLYVFRSFIR
jgi:hypothetical protein